LCQWTRYNSSFLICYDILLDLYTEFVKIAHETNNDAILTENSNPIYVIVGCDTRPSSEALVNSIIDAVKFFPKAKFVNYGLLTTPQLHWMVWRGNAEGVEKTEEDYYRHVAASYNALIDPLGKKDTKGKHNSTLYSCNSAQNLC
jgi:hypothetical protein